MESETPAREITARVDIRGMLRRRGIYGLIVLLCGAGLGVLASTKLTTQYSSTTKVLVTATGLPTSNTGNSLAKTEAPLNLETESQVIISQPVAAAAAKLARDTRPLTTLLKTVSVSVPPNTTVLNVTATDPSASTAQNVSHAFAQAYLENRNKTAQDSVDADIKTLNTQLATLNKALNAAIGPAASLPANSAARTYAEAQQRIITDQISAASDVINSLNSTQISGGSILSDASTPTGPSLPLRPLAIAGGALLGLVAGVLLMLLLERRDRVVRRPEDVESFAGVPVVGSSASRARRPRSGAPGLFDSWTALRHDVEAALPEGRAILMVVPIGTGPLSAYATASLAASFGRTGLRVGVVCGEIDNPLLSQMLGITQAEVGLVQALGGAAAPRLIKSPTQAGVSVLPTGNVAGGTRDLLHSRRFAALVLQLKDEYDLVIVQVLPAEAVALARSCDRTLLLVETGRSRYDDVRAVADQLERRGAPVAGAALFDGAALTAAVNAAAAVDQGLNSSRPSPAVQAVPDEPVDEGATPTSEIPLIRSVGS